MSKMKVYLAKSNRSNPDLVTRVRQTLSSYDIEIVEFTGGQYSHKPLKECEYLVVVPDLSDVSGVYDETIIDIGKGLFEQIENFSHINGSFNVIVISDNNLDVRSIESLEIVDEDDYINHGTLYLCDYVTSLNDVCNKKFNIKENNINSVEFGYKYLLRKRK